MVVYSETLINVVIIMRCNTNCFIDMNSFFKSNKIYILVLDYLIIWIVL